MRSWFRTCSAYFHPSRRFDVPVERDTALCRQQARPEKDWSSLKGFLLLVAVLTVIGGLFRLVVDLAVRSGVLYRR